MSVFKEIDIEKNGVIEASAGTGKTYTIENFVIRIIKEKRVLIDDILVVTFTEKAAGELRIRIREILEKEINKCEQSSKEKEFLEACLTNLNKSMIGTIHGFCNSVLKNFAFESGASFECELASGEVIANQALQKVIRNEVVDILKSCFQNFEDIGSFDQILKTAKKIIPKYRPESDIFKPEISQKPLQIAQEIKHVGSELDFNNADFEQIVEDAKNITYSNFSPKGKKLYKVITEGSLEAVFKILKNKNRKPIRDTVKNISGAETLLANAEEVMLEVVKKIVENKNQYEKLKNLFMLKIVQKISEAVYSRVAEIKSDYSLLTYDDMIYTVANALKEDSSSLAQILSAKYKYCIIDEFQDTSSLQWGIFKKIFLQENNFKDQKNRIYIVGDPKQSIYSFQGSDLNSYFEAKEAILTNVFNSGKFYTLKDNFRSHSDIISVCNKIFSFDDYKGESGLDSKIWSNFDDAGFGNGPKQIAMQNSEEPRVTVFKHISEKKMKKEEVKNLFYKTIADEINKMKKSLKSLSDIAILASTNKEADQIRAVLIKHGIDSIKYKQTGFFESKFMLEFVMVLDAICFPANIVKVKQALCTSFFFDEINRHKLEDVSQYCDIFYELKTASIEKNWAHFFSILTYSTNFIENISKLNSSDKNLREAFLRQAVKFCVSFLRKNSSMLEELVEKLKNYYDKIENPPDGEDCFEAPMQKDAVGVMTIHASKGLQFSVVFVCFEPDDNHKLKADYPIIINKGNGKREIALNKEADALNELPLAQIYKSEKLAEYKRLYYVALTRACEKLYLFVGEVDGEKGLAGDAIYHAIKTINSERAIREIIIDESGFSIPNKHENLSKETLETENVDKENQKSYDWLLKRRTYVHSYSSIVHQSLKKEKAKLLSQQDDIEDDIENVISTTESKDAGFVQSNENIIKDGLYKILEPGSEAGNILHKVFEDIDFKNNSLFDSSHELENDKNFTGVVEDVLSLYSKDFSYKNHIASIVHNTLNAIIDVNGEKFTLGMLKNENILREMEFYYTNPKVKGSSLIKGYIDLVFMHNNKYYILDWKSNMLDDYSQESIIESMTASGYFIQADIYANAVKVWLESRNPKFSYSKDFGGVIYVYLRGTKKETTKAIHSFTPDEKAITSFAESILF